MDGAKHTLGTIDWLPLLLLLAAAISAGRRLAPWEFMSCLAIAIFAGLKWLSWRQVRSQVAHAAWRAAAYLFLWPGMDAEAFLDEKAVVAAPQTARWLWASLVTAAGAVLLWVVARTVPASDPLAQGWVGMLGLVLLLHFGGFQLVALAWQALGVNAAPIMSAPLKSKSLSEFWGKRWNLGFRDLAHDFVFGPLRRRIGAGAAQLSVFAVSGLIHDLVISVPARGGYGLPTAYFLAQGIGAMIEHSGAGKKVGLGHGVMGWIFMAAFTAGPAFWLFHPPFVTRVMLPFMKAVGAL